MKVVPSSRTHGAEELWLLSDRLQKVVKSTINFSEVNYRILKSPVDDLIKDTICKASPDPSCADDDEFNYTFFSH